jgi:DNA repair exonuclease SbcCD ATPase subunit
MEAETASADELRLTYERAVDEVNRTTVSLRDRETLIKRLGALRAQYADDLTKLRFAARAGHLFDPLSLTACPSCLQPLDKPATPAEGACGLCAQPLRGLDDDTAFDVSKEIRTTETKLRELTTSIEEIESTVLQMQGRLDRGAQRRDAARTELDAAVSGRLAPFIAERDVVQNRVATAEQRRTEIARSRSFVAGIDDRRKRLAGLEREEERLKDRVAHLKEQGQDHAAVVSALSDRFGAILADFQFPKLDDPHLDEVFVPHVRGMKYSEIGSAGATTLISLAWHLAIFEVAADQEAAHPGILMIDSPQKNLLAESEPDFDGQLIADSVYEHMIRWSGSQGRSQQLILVDNSPRPSAEHHVVVRYSGDADRPPYGLIDDEVS